MLSIKNSTQMISELLKLDEKETRKYKRLLKPYIDLHKHLMKHLDLNSEETENITRAFVQNYIRENSDDTENEVNTFILSGKAMYEMAVNTEFEKPERLTKNSVKITEMIQSKVDD